MQSTTDKCVFHYPQSNVRSLLSASHYQQTMFPCLNCAPPLDYCMLSSIPVCNKFPPPSKKWHVLQLFLTPKLLYCPSCWDIINNWSLNSLCSIYQCGCENLRVSQSLLVSSIPKFQVYSPQFQCQ